VQLKRSGLRKLHAECHCVTPEFLADAPMATPLAPATHRATFALPNEQFARHIADFLTESLVQGDAAVAAFEGANGSWGIAVHFTQAPDEGAIRELVALSAGQEIARAIRFDTVAPKDWVKATLSELVPVHAGRFIVHGRHDRARVPPNKLAIEIEAALAFGTGHHGTTRGCLLLLDHVLKSDRPRRLLDLGSGTGVLAIAAAKALHRKVLASDIDPASVKVAAENARLNGVGDLVETIQATGFSAPQFSRHAPFDLVLANILANPLRWLATPMAAHLSHRRHLILSGLLLPQASAVIAAYRARGLVLRRHIRLEGWSSLLMRKAG